VRPIFTKKQKITKKNPKRESALAASSWAAIVTMSHPTTTPPKEAHRKAKKSKASKSERKHSRGNDSEDRKSKKRRKTAQIDTSEDVTNTKCDSEENPMKRDRTKSTRGSSIEAEAARSPSKSKVRHQPTDAPKTPQFPFFTQTVSIYVPLYPIGWDQPVTAAASQHLRPLINRYVPMFRGVLLDFRDVTVSEHPSRQDAALKDGDVVSLQSVDEYAVGFGWVTVEVDLFRPRRGAWMEGVINLQNEGHVGVVCWGKFNASIEARRLPPTWRWVHSESDEGRGTWDELDETASAYTAEDEHGAVKQMHSIGFWTDENGKKVRGRLRFRIKDFDVGISGDNSYLSLEGTVLDDAAELGVIKADAAEEMKRKGKNKNVLSKERRRVPDFSVTKFGNFEEDKKETEAEEELGLGQQETTSYVPVESEDE
jgi:DNA-directed RNA polymerase I subunit RPA43